MKRRLEHVNPLHNFCVGSAKETAEERIRAHKSSREREFYTIKICRTFGLSIKGGHCYHCAL